MHRPAAVVRVKNEFLAAGNREMSASTPSCKYQDACNQPACRWRHASPYGCSHAEPCRRNGCSGSSLFKFNEKPVQDPRDRAEVCTFHDRCMRANCKRAHPRDLCKKGKLCRQSDCPAQHPQKACSFAAVCDRDDCKYFHPTNPCPAGGACTRKGCQLLHPSAQLKPACKFGRACEFGPLCGFGHEAADKARWMCPTAACPRDESCPYSHSAAMDRTLCIRGPRCDVAACTRYHSRADRTGKPRWQ